jgi:hypothetical protein
MGTYTRTGIAAKGSFRSGDERVGHHGTMTLRDCHVQGFSGNGVYASRTPGVVRVRGGLFRNNDVSQVRVGNKGSSVANANIEVDSTKSNSPNPEDALNQRGIQLDGDKYQLGSEIVDCDIKITDTP